MIGCSHCSHMQIRFTANGVEYGMQENVHASLPIHYGNLEVALITDQRVFFNLLDEMCKESVEKSDAMNFYHNRVAVLDAFMQRRLFGLSITETDEMFNQNSMSDMLFMVEGFYDVPCFCMTAKQEPDKVDMIWVANRARGKGMKQFMMDELRLKPT